MYLNVYHRKGGTGVIPQKQKPYKTVSLQSCPLQDLSKVHVHVKLWTTHQGSKFIFGFGSTCASTRCKFLGAELKILGTQLQILHLQHLPQKNGNAPKRAT